MTPELLIEFLNDPGWDAPFFKRLAHNDTGQAVGHQGGIVIPKDLRPYFPTLDESQASGIAPTVDRHLIADMFIPGQQVGTDVIRYQYQTWGGTRQAESRITDNLGPIRGKAHGGDLLIMQRGRDQLTRFRLLLVRQSDLSFNVMQSLTSGRRWGPLFIERPPISQGELAAAQQEVLAEAQQPFVPVRDAVPRTISQRAAIARDTAFRGIILGQYERRCCVSGIALQTPTNLFEVEAAHVIPLGRGGADEPRNGISLAGTLHWAFDRGLFGIDGDRRVFVPSKVLAMPQNEFLKDLHKKSIAEARDSGLRVASEALSWHLGNVVSAWS